MLSEDDVRTTEYALAEGDLVFTTTNSDGKKIILRARATGNILSETNHYEVNSWFDLNPLVYQEDVQYSINFKPLPQDPDGHVYTIEIKEPRKTMKVTTSATVTVDALTEKNVREARRAVGAGKDDEFTITSRPKNPTPYTGITINTGNTQPMVYDLTFTYESEVG